MSRDLAGKLPRTFMSELRSAVSSMHQRGVVHLDLRHRSNVLADANGQPVLIDFASAVFFKPTSLGYRFLAPLLAKVDWGAVGKWEVRLRVPGSVSATNSSDDEPNAGSATSSEALEPARQCSGETNRG